MRLTDAPSPSGIGKYGRGHVTSDPDVETTGNGVWQDGHQDTVSEGGNVGDDDVF